MRNVQFHANLHTREQAPYLFPSEMNFFFLLEVFVLNITPEVTLWRD